MQPVPPGLTTLESASALDRYELDNDVQMEALVVDRLEDEEDAIVLVGASLDALLLPRSLLRIAGLEREKARGIIQATHTASGIDLDVWPLAGVDDCAEWQPNPSWLTMRVEVGA